MEPAIRANPHAEPKPRAEGALAAASDPFLTPRVIDRLAFEEYGRLLRGEIERATKESELLARRAEAAAVVLDQLESFIGGNADAIERAAEILTGIDDRAARTRELLQEIDRRADALSRAADRFESEADARTEQFEHRLRNLVDTAMDRFEETEDQLVARAASMRRSLIDRLEEIRSKGESALERLEQRGASLVASAEQDLERLEQRSKAERLAGEELSARLAGLSAQHEERTSALLVSVETSLSTAERRIDERAASAEQRFVDHAGRADAAARRADDLTATLEQLLGHVERQAAKIEVETKNAASTIDAHREQTLRSVAERLDAAATERLAQLTDALDRQAGDRAASIEHILERLEAAGRSAEQVLTSSKLRSLLTRCERAEDAAATAAMRFEQLADQTGVAAKTLGETLLAAASRVDELDAHAATLLERAQGPIEALAPVVERAQRLAEQLQPWVELLGPRSAGRAPAPIADLLDEVRSAAASAPTARDEELRAEVQGLSEMVLALSTQLAAMEKKLQPPKPAKTPGTKRGANQAAEPAAAGVESKPRTRSKASPKKKAAAPKRAG
ncbi:MAG: hypothetical protein ACTS22_09155 [Phycisphaerales bacterium]